jgi:hypothetical protein
MVGIAFALFPFFTLPYLLYGDVNSKVFFTMVLTSALAFVAAYRLFSGIATLSTSRTWIFAGLLAVLITQYAATIFGVYPARSLWSDIFWGTGTLFFTHLAFLAFFLGELLNDSDWSLVRLCIAYSAGIFGLLTIVGEGGLGLSGRFLWVNLDPTLTLGNETYAGTFLLLALIFGLIEFFRTQRGTFLRKSLSLSLLLAAFSPLLFNVGILWGKTPIAAVLSSPLTLLGGARASSAALFALIGFLMGYLLLKRFVRAHYGSKAVLLWSGIVVLSLVGGVLLLMTPGSLVQQAYVSESSAARIIAWDSGIRAFGDRPLLGWGPENFNYAFEANFDSRIFEEKNLGEIWFERAHNIFIDTLVTVGIMGTLAIIVLIAAYLFTIYQALRERRISEMEAVLLFSLVPAHLLQTQTGFDTAVSYTLLAVFLGYAFFIGRGESLVSRPWVKKTVAVGITGVAIASLALVVLPEYSRQVALMDTLKATTAEAQKRAIEKSLSRTSSFESLRLSSSSFIRGALAAIAEDPSPQKVKITLEYMEIYAKHYETFLHEKPENYRAHINYAYLLLLQTALGENRLTQARELIDTAYPLSPGHPLTYILDSVAHLYSGKLKEADELMKKALAVNPDVEFTQEAAAYLERQKKQFPNISVLKISNL